MDTTASARNTASANENYQKTQQELIKQAEAIPGVAEAMEAYSRMAPYATFVASQPVIKTSYATGGNA